MRTALFRYGNSSAFTMKPARSLTSTGVLAAGLGEGRGPRRSVSSLAVSGRTISTRLITGAGLKKWTPQTRSGRLVSIAISTTGRVEVLVARMASASADVVELAEQLLLDGEVLDDRLDDEVAVGEVVELGGGGDPGEITASRSASSSLPRSTCLASDFSSAATMASALSCWRDRSTTSMPGLGGHLGDARAHDPRPDDAHSLHRSPRTLPGR